MADIEKLQEAQNEEQGITKPSSSDFAYLPTEKRLLSFKALEREYFFKDPTWYFWVTIFILASVAYFIYEGSFSSAIVFIFILSFLYIYGNHPPRIIEIHFTEDGLYMNKMYYDFNELNCFWIINSEKENVHSLNFETGKKIKRIITIQLHDIDDNYIKVCLKDKVEEDFEREEPHHVRLSRFFRL